MSSDPSPVEPRRRARRSLAVRLNAWYVIVFVASLTALVAFAVPTVASAFDNAERVVLESRVERHVAVLSASGLPEYRAAVEHSSALGAPEVPVRVRDLAGNTVYEHGDVGAARATAAREIGELQLEVGTPPAPWSEVEHRLRGGALALALGALVLAVVGGYALTRRALRPVRALASTAREVIRSGDLSRRVPTYGTGDELDEVSALFNRVLARNQRLVGGMRDALDNVAHDLRTPLTRLRGTAELALRGSDADSARDALAICIEESDHVLVMLRALMDISEAEAGLLKLAVERTSLDRLADSVAELYAHVADDAEVSLAVVHDPAAVAELDPARARQAIANLVDNAIKYTPAGGAVTIELAHDDAAAIVRVRDTGIGIDDAALPRIWDRLYRAEPSRSKPGLGLGLSLVQAIARAHGGRVEVDSAPGRGSTFTIAWPTVRATTPAMPRG